ncbi:MAG: hypothetical protein Q7S17_00445 [Xanthobacteraceae bacterium]|nr:hypothetical protein [Xanthobacteraceae bacterium]
MDRGSDSPSCGAGDGGREAKRSGLAAASILTARLLVVENFSGQDEIRF